MFRKKFSFLFVFIFLPAVVTVNKNIKIDHRFESKKNVNVNVIVEKKLEDTLSLGIDKIPNEMDQWYNASGSHYGDLKKVGNGKGIGSWGRKIESGSIALGSYFTEDFLEKGLDVFIEVKDCDIVTPYGKGIFRVDDKMAKRFNRRKNKYYIDFFSGDLSSKHKYIGRFKIKFRIVKIVKTVNSSL